MIKEKHRYSELTGKIIGCSMEVHMLLLKKIEELTLHQIEMKKEIEILKLRL